MTTETTATGGTIIIPDTGVTYYMKIGLKQVGHDIGFFDAFPTPTYPYYPGDGYVVYGIGEGLLMDNDYI